MQHITKQPSAEYQALAVLSALCFQMWSHLKLKSEKWQVQQERGYAAYAPTLWEQNPAVTSDIFTVECSELLWDT